MQKRGLGSRCPSLQRKDERDPWWVQGEARTLAIPRSRECPGLRGYPTTHDRGRVKNPTLLLAILLGFGIWHCGTEVDDAEFTVVLGGVSGPVRRLLGINGGPYPQLQCADFAEAYRQMGVETVRTHDFYGPLDMATLYPNRLMPPSLDISFDFTSELYDDSGNSLGSSDNVFAAILDGGFEPYFRLGDSWNNISEPKTDTERGNYVRAAVKVVDHYLASRWGQLVNGGSVEIWNEPDGRFWKRPREEFFDLFAEIAMALKAKYPNLKVGGPGVTPWGYLSGLDGAPGVCGQAGSGENGWEWVRSFLGHLRSREVPLDFFSWHMYSNKPEEYGAAARFYRSELDCFGFSSAALHITEWNTSIEQADPPMSVEEQRRWRDGSLGTSRLTAAWMALQKAGVTQSMIYRGAFCGGGGDNGTNLGILAFDGRRKATADAFELWAGFSNSTQLLNATLQPAASTNLEILAGMEAGGDLRLLVTNLGREAIRWKLESGDRSCGETAQVSELSGEDATPSSYSWKLDLPFESDPSSVILITLDCEP